ncbi:MAG: hypothetical protein ACP5LZ_05715 [Fervidicoccaceae archaeon]
MNSIIFVMLLLFSVVIGSMIGLTMKRRGISSSNFKGGFSLVFELVILILVFFIGAESSLKLGSEEIIQGILAIALGVTSAIMSSVSWQILERGSKK